jgi:hypothetical protein
MSRMVDITLASLIKIVFCCNDLAVETNGPPRTEDLKKVPDLGKLLAEKVKAG